MNVQRLLMPWARPCDLYSQPGSVLVKLRLGEAPDDIPPGRLVRAQREEAAGSFAIGPLDRVLRHFSHRVAITRVHAPAREQFDDIEHATGVARTFHVAAEHSCCIDELVDALRMLHVVERVSPQYLCAVPMRAGTALPAPVDLDAAWTSREQVNALQALAYEPGDPATMVEVLDTGVAAHPELAANVRMEGPDVVQLGSGDLASGLELLGDNASPD